MTVGVTGASCHTMDLVVQTLHFPERGIVGSIVISDKPLGMMVKVYDKMASDMENNPI